MTVIHQITDPHIPVSGDLSVRDNFQKLIEYVEKYPPDLLTLTGDLPGEDGNRDAYVWIRDQLPITVPCLVIPGNHDDPVSLFEVFGGDLNQNLNKNRDFYERMALDEIDLIFTNTATDRLPDDQIALLQDETIRPGSILFIHHPTKEISGGFMDTVYPLQNRDAVDEAIASSAIDHVFCGHFHTEFTVEDDYNLHVTPSPAFDVSRDPVEIEINPARIPLREIVVQGNTVATRVIYLDE